MQSQKSNEEIERELREEINKDYRKSAMFPDTVIGRKRFREFRISMYNIGISIGIPFSDARFTHEYCKQYAAIQESDAWKYDDIAQRRKADRFVRDWGDN